MAETDVRWKYHWKAGNNGKAIEYLKERIRLTEAREAEDGQERIATPDYLQLYSLFEGTWPA